MKEEWYNYIGKLTISILSILMIIFLLEFIYYWKSQFEEVNEIKIACSAELRTCLLAKDSRHEHIIKITWQK